MDEQHTPCGTQLSMWMDSRMRATVGQSSAHPSCSAAPASPSSLASQLALHAAQHPPLLLLLSLDAVPLWKSASSRWPPSSYRPPTHTPTCFFFLLEAVPFWKAQPYTGWQATSTNPPTHPTTHLLLLLAGHGALVEGGVHVLAAGTAHARLAVIVAPLVVAVCWGQREGGRKRCCVGGYQ